MSQLFEIIEVENFCGWQCDRCGIKLAVENCGHIHGEWGYPSKKDGQEESCDLCEECFQLVLDFLTSIKAEYRVNPSHNDNLTAAMADLKGDK